jgi:hypothetical protein
MSSAKNRYVAAWRSDIDLGTPAPYVDSTDICLCCAEPDQTHDELKIDERLFSDCELFDIAD